MKPNALILAHSQAEMRKALKNTMTPEYVPTGIQDDIITSVAANSGEPGKSSVFEIRMPNKVGKTCAGIGNVFKEIIWPSDNKYFDFDIFNNWIYPKSAMIVGTKENVRDGGPIREEITKWWPRGRYTEDKAGRNFVSLYTTDTGWKITVMTHDQLPTQFEGPLRGLVFVDEPGKAFLVGALNSRVSDGGILIYSYTPWNAGEMVDALEDLETDSKGLVKIHRIECDDMAQDDAETGKPNRFKERKGRRSTEQIENYINTLPKAQRPARVHAQSSHNSGRIYDFIDSAHIRDFQFGGEYMKSWTNYHIMDPHLKAYPFNLWIGVTPEGAFVVWNEWPDFDELGMYYDQARETVALPHHFKYDVLAKLYKHMDFMPQGMGVYQRFIDPLYAKGLGGEHANSQSVQTAYAKSGLDFACPPVERISVQRDSIIDLMSYDKNHIVCPENQPRLYVMPHCVNIIRMLKKHYWMEGKEQEAEAYKDGPDCIRYLLAGLGNKSGYVPPELLEKKANPVKLDFSAEKPVITHTGLG